MVVGEGEGNLVSEGDRVGGMSRVADSVVVGRRVGTSGSAGRGLLVCVIQLEIKTMQSTAIR
jgi:hypothetical protein